MAYTLSNASLAKLDGVHPRLVAVVKRAIELSKVDFKVVEGVRSRERQRQLYAQGRTKPGKKVTWTMNSRHFTNPQTGFGHAVDLLPAPYDWAAKNVGGRVEPWDTLIDAMMAAAKELGISIRSGYDWDMDGARREKGETDGPHFELTN